MNVFNENNSLTLASGATVPALTAINTVGIDMAGYDELAFLVNFGLNVAGSVITVTAVENTTNTLVGATPITLSLASAGVITAGALVLTDVAANTANKLVAINLKGSSISKRFVFLTITGTVANFGVNSIIASASEPRNAPVTQSASVFAMAQAAT